MNIIDVLIQGLGTTVIGMSIVFLTLIAIAFIIYLLKYVNQEEQKQPAAPVLEETKEKVIQPEIEEIQTTEQDDLALVAAITAALAASIDTSANDLKIVSIKKSDMQNWKNVTRREQHRHIY